MRSPLVAAGECDTPMDSSTARLLAAL